jgi:two-component system, sensor histidine kinase RegB
MSIMSLHSPFDLSTVGGVRLRTLVLVRWVAIAGQLATVLGVQFGLGMELPLNALLTAIVASAVLNLALTLWKPVQRLNEAATTVLLAYDILQLTALLYFTGGLSTTRSR